MEQPYFCLSPEGQQMRYCWEKYRTEFGGFIHPTVRFKGTVTLGRGVIIEEGCEVGNGCFFGHYAIMRPGSVIGDHSELRAWAWIANNVYIGHHTVLYQYSNVSFKSVIGDYVYFGVRCTTTNASDIVLHRGREFIPKPCVIGDGVRVATDSLLLPGVHLGRNCLIGAKSLVTKNVPAGEVWMGHPAKFVKKVPEDDIPVVWKELNER